MQSNYRGLCAKEAALRLSQNGENRISGKKGPGISAMFFSQFKDLMIIILAIATIVSVLMGEGTEAVTIIAIVLLNATLGFLQEFKTEKTLEALKELSAPSARVWRDGILQSINARELVCGDLIALEAGDKIPADCTVHFAAQLSCDEAMLTGESSAVQKHEGDKLFMGCIAASGRGEGLVTHTGMDTEMGKIAHLVNEAEEEPTPLQIKLKQLGKFVAAACLIVCLSVALLGYIQGNNFLDMLLTGISLAVAAIPEGLPAIVTITLALSVGRILKKGAVIRRLHAVETLGCAGVICTDKTGTITQNKMTVKHVFANGKLLDVSGEGYAAEGEYTQNNVKQKLKEEAFKALFTCAALCTSAAIRREGQRFITDGDATETAVLIAAAKAGYTSERARAQNTPISENPFDSRRKMMSVTARTREGDMLFCKGAPDVLLQRCTHILKDGTVRAIAYADLTEISAAIEHMSRAAMRVLGFAQGSAQNGEDNMTFLGLMAMLDPPRAEVKGAVRRCKSAGIRPVMITGDHKETAIAIAKLVGIYKVGDNVLQGDELDKLTDTQLCAAASRTSVYARVSPAHKLRIVRAYKAAGQVVAMTGDGVNDAPAVKEADIGVAMGIAGTDVTKEASGVVILDDNFATIVSAVEEGRVIYQNIRRFIRFLLTSNLGEVLSMLFGMLLMLPVSLLPIQILLVNLLTDGLPAVALGMEPPSADIMLRRPRPKSEGLFAKGLLRTIILRGIMLGTASCGAFWAVYTLSADIYTARSACFLTIVFSQMLHIFECRGEGFNVRGNFWLIGAVGISAFSACAICYLPLAQGFFGTAAVRGTNLLIVFAASVLGPIAMSAARFIKRIFRA